MPNHRYANSYRYARYMPLKISLEILAFVKKQTDSQGKIY